MLAIALPWYVLVCCRLPEFARHFLWEHNVMRFAQPFDHIRPVWFYGPILLGGLLPVAFFARGLTRFLLSGKAAKRAPSLAGVGLSAAGGRMVRVVFLDCRLQAADVHPARIRPVLPGGGLRGLGTALASWPRSARGADRLLAAIGGRALRADPVVRVAAFTTQRARRAPGAMS